MERLPSKHLDGAIRRLSGANPSQSVAIRRNPSQSGAPPARMSTWMVQSSVEETAAKDRGWRRKKSSSPKMPPLTCMHPSNPRQCWCTQVQSVAINPPDDRIAHIAIT